jgi:teichuronic acid biosynthesis glycosyltransferase TuaC
VRVLVVTNMFPTATEPAFGRFVKEQADDLRRLGVDIDLLSFDGRARWKEYFTAVVAVRRRLRRSRHDLIHAHYGLSGAVAAMATLRTPLVTTFHGSDYEGASWQRWISAVVARRSASIVVSRAGCRRLFARNAAVIPMGVDTTVFVPRERDAARRSLGWREGGHYALLAGARSNPVKGAPLFDAAVRRAADRLPTLTGVALDGLARADVPLAFNAADVVVVASIREGSPLAVRESLACATPVVAVPVGDVPTVIAGLPGCAIVPRDDVALADAICAAVEARRDSSLRARAEASSRDEVARQVLGVYELLLNRGKTQ